MSGAGRQVQAGSRALTAFSARSSGVSVAVSVHSSGGTSIVTRIDAGPVHSIRIRACAVRSQAAP